MEETLYWIIEYCKVLFGYGFLMFIWPMVVFRKYLKGKSVTFRFSFCVTGQVVLVNTVVLMLGLLHILNDWTLRILFYGTFLYSIRELYWLIPERKRKFKYLINGTFGWKNFFLLERRKLIRVIEEFCKRMWRFYKKHWLEYSMLLIVVIYGVLYFAWGVFHDRSYAFSDMYVHHSWIYQLTQGTVFADGIYPQGMHCMIYAVSALFPIRLYSCVLFSASVNVALVLISAYCLMKELFRWRYSAIFVLIGLLTFGEIKIIVGMARMQCALPQEVAFPAIFLCCLYLMRYLKGGRQTVIRGKKTNRFWDENLLVFTLALAVTIEIHFYATFMAFFLCVGVALFLWKRIFTRERFLPLVTAAILGVVIAVVPMVAGFATGIPLQGSLNWAIGVMQNSPAQEQEEQADSAENEDFSQVKNESTGGVAPDVSAGEEIPVANIQEASLLKKVAQAIWDKCKTIAETVYVKTYLEMYETDFLMVLFAIMIVILFGGTIGAGVIALIEKKWKKRINPPSYGGYFIIIYSSLVYVVNFAAADLGLPVLLMGVRLVFISHLLILMIMIIPIDIVFDAGTLCINKKILHVCSVGIAGGIFAIIYGAGLYHGYLYFEVTRYDATVQVTNKIIEQLPENSYTIVSPTEELYQVIEYGRHEELLDFIEKQDKGIYEIPTEYVFLFLEKRPFKYAQCHFFDGPKWLANDRYRSIYAVNSVYPEYISTEVDEYFVEKDIMYFSKLADSDAMIASRTILQSKLWKWCEQFQEKYPNEFKTFYEDENFVCYYFRQNTQKLFNLDVK